MADIIQLLPDSIASQIAAGEVIQRPSSVVKELMENSIDAGSDTISLVIKDAGKTLIQVVDNGIGMSPTDSRMCFERHATSKIKDANDIFKITTKGFRGEALASIAAIAHVELISRQKNDLVGTKVVILGSKFSKQESVQSEYGTKISVKNLFFNVPARRKFLKSDNVEFKHIIDEFFRLALAHTGISFTLYHNGKELYRLQKSNLKQRIVNIFGRGYENKLLPVEENMELLNVSGYIGKIDATRKSRNNQYIFVNNRFIRSNYLAHAVKSAYDEYIADDQNPVYFLYLNTDPANIDVNIHPTKQEIKFEDEKLIYNYIKVVIKRILGKFHYTPSLDFDTGKDNHFISGSNKKNTDVNFRPGTNFVSSNMKKSSPDEWEKAFEILNEKDKVDVGRGINVNVEEIPSKINKDSLDFNDNDNIPGSELFQINRSYIIKEVETGFLLIDQYYAHQRVLYEKYLKMFSSGNPNIQQLLFPVKLEAGENDKIIFEKILPELKKYGFNISKNNENEYYIEGIPDIMGNSNNVQEILNDILSGNETEKDIKSGLNKKIARILAGSTAKNKGKKLSGEEMNYLVDKLFSCENPYKSPTGKKTFIILETKEIINRFNS